MKLKNKILRNSPISFGTNVISQNVSPLFINLRLAMGLSISLTTGEKQRNTEIIQT